MAIKIENLTDIALILGNRLKNHLWIQEISLQKKNFIPFIQAFPWDIQTLSHGIPGLICLYSELDDFFPNEGWDLAAHHYIVELIKDLEKNGFRNASLFSGLTGICFSIQIASKGGIRYQTLIKRLVPILLERIELEYLQPIKENSKNKPLSPFQYDVIVGISGIVSFLLTVRNIPLVESILHRSIELLVSLKEPILYQGRELPGWYVPNEYAFRDEIKAQYPHGYFDNGMAHGLAGCIAALSKAYKDGIRIPNQASTIREMCHWMTKKQIKTGIFKNGWAARLAYHSIHEQLDVNATDFHRDGWCYGDPGIASALLQASEALGDKKLGELSINSLISVCERSFSERNLDCVSVCHGQGGFLAILHHFYLETGLKIFQETSQKIIEFIIEKYDENLPFGFESFSSIPNSNDQNLIDNVGLLDGTIGTLLSLLFSTSKEKRLWTDIFLL